MDPISALGLACNILQLVEQGIKAATVCKELYQQGSLDLHNKIEKYAEQISTANRDLKAAFQTQALTTPARATRLQDMANDASTAAAELVKVLNQLKLPKKQMCGAFRTFLKTFAKKKTIDGLRIELERHDAALRSGLLKEL